MIDADPLNQLRQQLETAALKHRAGDLGGAAQIYRAVLGQYPDQPDALHTLGVIAQQMGNSALALQLFDETVRVAPHFGQAQINRATLLHAIGRDDEALIAAQHAVKAEPHLADGWNIAGILLRHHRRYEEAKAHHEQAISRNQTNPYFYNNYAIVLSILGLYQDAYRAAQKAVQLNPSFAAGFLTLADIVSGMGHPDRAFSFYHEAQRLDPKFNTAFISEGRTALLVGEMAHGLELLERRPLYTHDNERLKGLPRWKGDKVGHLLLASEQGAGDTLQFMRYIPHLRERVGHITLQTPHSLRRLVMASCPDISVIAPDEALPVVDAFAPLMSLPYHFQTRLDTIPAQVPYIHVDQTWCAPWRDRINGIKSPRIGLVWAGNPFQLADYARSMILEQVEPLVSTARVHLVSLQKGPTQRDLSGMGVFDAAPWMDDFAATAGLMSQLDLVITTCTSSAHLAGGLGVPVWLMATFAADWRWMLGREDSPWYPTLRIFRQKTPRDWASVVDDVQKELNAFLGGNRAVLTPPRWEGLPVQANPYAIDIPSS